MGEMEKYFFVYTGLAVCLNEDAVLYRVTLINKSGEILDDRFLIWKDLMFAYNLDNSKFLNIYIEEGDIYSLSALNVEEFGVYNSDAGVLKLIYGLNYEEVVKFVVNENWGDDGATSGVSIPEMERGYGPFYLKKKDSEEESTIEDIIYFVENINEQLSRLNRETYNRKRLLEEEEEKEEEDKEVRRNRDRER